MENEYIIPANYTDAGKLLGAFEIRRAAEAILLCVPLALILLKLSPFGLTGTVVLVSAPLFCARRLRTDRNTGQVIA